MNRCSLSNVDMRYLGELVTRAFDLQSRHLFWKSGSPRTMEARRFFCLHLYVVEAVPYKRISKFLRLNPDGARMLMRNLATRDPFPYTDLMQKVTTDFRRYLENKKNERQAESSMGRRHHVGVATAAEAHEGAP
jgi:hypothetical protein